MHTPIQNTLGENIDYSFAAGIAGHRKTDWLVILGHGVTGNKDRPVVVDTASALNAAGFDTLRFSFSGNGESGGDFRDATISKEVGDLSAVLTAASAAYPKVAYIGHSMGAAVGVIQASHDTRIHTLVSLAGMVDTKTFAQTEFGDITPDVDCMWDEPDCPLSSKYMHDLTETIGSVASIAELITVPWLLIHGTADDVVLPQDSEQIKQLQGDNTQLVRIEGADHSFNETTHKATMIQAVCEWLSAHA